VLTYRSSHLARPNNVTVPFALMAVAVDFVGWQCPDLPQCADRLGPLKVLAGQAPTGPWLRHWSPTARRPRVKAVGAFGLSSHEREFSGTWRKSQYSPGSSGRSHPAGRRSAAAYTATAARALRWTSFAAPGVEERDLLGRQREIRWWRHSPPTPDALDSRRDACCLGLHRVVIG